MRRLGLASIRYGIGGLLVLVGIVLLIVNPGGFGVDGFAMSVGSGLSVLLVNAMYRVSLDSSDDREREEQARRYLAEHGHWPDEPDEPDAPGE
jgi:hypothetical protein